MESRYRFSRSGPLSGTSALMHLLIPPRLSTMRGWFHGRGRMDAALPLLRAEVCSPARVVRAGLRGLAAPLESVQGFAMAPL